MSKAAVHVALAAALIGGCETGSTPARPIRATPAPEPAVPNNKVPPTTQQTTSPPTAADPLVVTVGTTRVTRSELDPPLLQAYGFNLLMLVVQRDMARDACREQKLVVTADDLRKEFDFALETIFQKAPPDEDREKLLEQYLAQPKPRDQSLTRTEFDIVIETNAYLRKLVTPSANKAVTDEMLQQQFDEEYGAQVKVRSIVVDNPQDARDVRARLDAGEDFAAVCRQVSRDPSTRNLGGERPAFGLNTPGWPENFKRVAFSLKPGDVSDPVSAGGGYHLIKLDRRIAPKAVKFDDVKASLREDVEARAILELVKNLRARLAQQALAQMQISEPTLKAEFEKRMQTREQMLRDREKIRDQMEKDRAKANQPATAPATAGTPGGPVGPVAATNPVDPPPPPPKPATTTPTATEPVAPPADVAGPATRPAPQPAPVPPPAASTKPVAPAPAEAPAPPPPKPATTTPTATEPVAPPADVAGPATRPAATRPDAPATRPSSPAVRP